MRAGSRHDDGPASGRTEWLITSTVSTAGMSAALQEFASEVGAGPDKQVWPLLHEALPNRDFVDMDEHAVVTAARCRELSAQPDVVRGRTHFHWWPADRAPCAERAAS